MGLKGFKWEVMENKKDRMLIAFVLSSVCGLIIFLMYYLPIFALKAVFEVQNIREFVFSMYSSIQFCIWFIIALSCLLGFFSVIMLFINDRSYKSKRKISNFLLFLIIAFALSSTFFYYGVFHDILIQEAGTFLYVVFTIVNCLLSIYLIYALKYLFFYFYKTLLDAFSLDSRLFIFDESDISRVASDENDNLHYVENDDDDIEERLFHSNLYTIISYANRNKFAIGLTAYKITNKESLIEEYGLDEYTRLERHFISILTARGREGENVFFMRHDYIASLLFATEDSACKAVESFNSLLEHNIFNSDVNKKNAPANFSNVRFVISAAGFDFSQVQATVSINILIDKLYHKIEEALEEAEALGGPVIYYE